MNSEGIIPTAGPPSPAAKVKPGKKNLSIFAYPIAWAVLAIALAASTGGWFIARKHEELTARKQFEEEASRIQTALSERMSVYEDVLHGGVGLFAASVSVERAEWKAYVETVSVNKRFPGIDGIGFIANVPRAQLEAFLKTTRDDKTPAFQLQNPGTNDDLFVVKYLEPEAEHARLLGIDMGTEPQRRAAAEKARDTGMPVLTPQISLRGTNATRRSGLMMLLPVFRNGTPTDTPESRRANIAGWVYGRFITTQLMRGILGEKAQMLHFEVIDRADQEAETLIFDSAAEPGGAQKNYRSRFTQVDSLAVGRRVWLLRFSTRPAFDAAISRSAEKFVAAGGGLISLLLFGIALSLSTTRARALNMAKDMTVAFRAANERLEKESGERQRSAAALEHERFLLRTLMDNLPDRIYFKDAQSRFLRNSRAHLRRFGLERASDAMGKTDADFFSEEHARQAFADEQRLMRGGPPMTKEEKETWPDGSVSWALSTKLPLRDETGNVVGTFGISHDITERKRAEEAVRESEARARLATEAAGIAVWDWDVKTNTVKWDAKMFTMYGLPPKPGGVVTYQDWADRVLASDLAEQAAALERTVATCGQSQREFRIVRASDQATRVIQAAEMVVAGNDGKAARVVGMNIDITERRQAEAALRQARDEAEEASRTKSQFLANMSHELRTPLNSVIGFAGILLKNKPDNLRPSDLNFLERIQANGKHLLVLINEILDLSKIEARKVELQLAPVALDVLVRETIAQQEGLVRDRPVQLLADVPATVALIQADADKLRQVIINLIGNALKFTERGSVTVRVVADPADHRPLRIEVADTGIGIPREKLGVIFEAFQQADASTARKYGGTGLGLTISQALCQLMGCRIEVASEPGRGSTFSVILGGKNERVAPAAPDAPAMKNSTEISAEISAGPTPSGLCGKMVLVIDDESDSRVLLTHLLEEFGCQVIAANSGEQGLRMAREFRPQLITVDLLMPQMDGASVIRALKADPELRAIPLVVVSIVAEERRGSILGAVDILEKPVVREELQAALRRSLLPAFAGPEPATGSAREAMARAKILVVDDEEDARRILLAHLADMPVEARTAANGQEALAALETFLPDLVLLDLIMPVMDGVAFLDALRTDPRYQHLPVIVITSKELSLAEKAQLRRQTLEVVKKSDLSEKKFKQLLQRILNQAGDSRRQPAAAG